MLPPESSTNLPPNTSNPNKRADTLNPVPLLDPSTTLYIYIIPQIAKDRRGSIKGPLGCPERSTLNQSAYKSADAGLLAGIASSLLVIMLVILKITKSKQ